MDDFGIVRRPRHPNYGLAAATPATPPNPTTYGVGGAAVGAALGYVGAKAIHASGLAGAAVGAVAGGAGGYYYAKGQNPTATTTPAPTPVGSSMSVVLSPGAMTGIGLSLSTNNTATFVLPTGASGSVNLLSSDATTVQATGMTASQPATATAIKVGTATLAAAWTDANGTTQTSTIPVTVTA